MYRGSEWWLSRKTFVSVCIVSIRKTLLTRPLRKSQTLGDTLCASCFVLCPIISNIQCWFWAATHICKIDTKCQIVKNFHYNVQIGILFWNTDGVLWISSCKDANHKLRPRVRVSTCVSPAWAVLWLTSTSSPSSISRATSHGCPCPEERESVWPSPRRETRGLPPSRAAAKLPLRHPDTCFWNKLLFTKHSACFRVSSVQQGRVSRAWDRKFELWAEESWGLERLLTDAL